MRGGLRLKERLYAAFANFANPEMVLNAFAMGEAADEYRQIQVNIGGNPVIFTVPDFNTGLADKKDPNVATAVRLIKSAISGLPIIVESGRRVGGEMKYIPRPDSELAILLRTPNPFHTKGHLIRHFCQGFIVHGKANALMVIENNVPVEIWPSIPGQLVYAKNERNIPIGYIFGKGTPYQRTLPLEAVIQIINYDADDPFEGSSPLEAIKEQMLSNYHAVQYNKQHFKQGPNAGLILKDKANYLGADKAKKDAFLDSVKRSLQGMKNANGVGMLPQNIDTEWNPHTIKDMQFAEGSKFNREQIYGNLGATPSEAGVYEYANYANALIQKRTFWENTLIPIIAILEEGFDSQIIRPWFPDENLRMRFDLSKVGALQDDRETKARTDQIYINSGVKVPNEVRRELGLEPIEGGDEVRVNNPMPAAAPESTPNNSDSENQGGNNSRAGKQFRSPDRIGANGHFEYSDERFEKWFALDRRTRKREAQIRAAYKAEIDGYFDGQRQRLIKKLKKITSDGSLMAMIYLEIKKFDAGDIPEDPNDLLNPVQETEILRDTVAPFHKRIVREMGQAAIDEAGVDVTFNIKNPKVQSMLERMVNRSEMINDKTFDDIRDILRQAYDEGWALGKTSKEINSLYSDYSLTRSSVIVRTEMGGVVNAASRQGYDQANVKSEWVATMDDKTRDAHMDADGQIVQVGEKFLVGSELLESPGDPTGSPENTIQCRCAVAPVI